MIELRHVSIVAGSFLLDDVSLQIDRGQYAVLMGPSGQGKTTILESLCGLRTISSGTILIDGVDVTAWPPADRQIGYVPQDLALFPTMTVRENLEFALRLRQETAPLIARRTEELAHLLGISHLLSRGVRNLSGGESQRVALGRALSFRPSVLLLDEPLSALDEARRHDMQQLLRSVQQSTGVTTLHVTHSGEEAEALADCVLTLRDGAVVSSHTSSGQAGAATSHASGTCGNRT
jgi:ABC-type sugar transport system ATPase subunit